LCRELVRQEVASTSQLLDILQKREGTEIRDWFEKMLKSELTNSKEG
jgi:hypothetical protein